jgi:hypothetical protein
MDEERDDGRRRKMFRIEQPQRGERVSRRRGLVAPPPVEPTSEQSKFGFEGKSENAKLCRESLEDVKLN